VREYVRMRESESVCVRTREREGERGLFSCLRTKIEESLASRIRSSTHELPPGLPGVSGGIQVATAFPLENIFDGN